MVWNMLKVNNNDTRNDVIDDFLVLLLLTMNIFHIFL